MKTVEEVQQFLERAEEWAKKNGGQVSNSTINSDFFSYRLTINLWLPSILKPKEEDSAK